VNMAGSSEIGDFVPRQGHPSARRSSSVLTCIVVAEEVRFGRTGRRSNGSPEPFCVYAKDKRSSIWIIRLSVPVSLFIKSWDDSVYLIASHEQENSA